MEPFYRKQYTISDLHLDCFGRVKPSVLLFFAQDAATSHCKLLGLDWDTMQKRNLFWAVTRNRVEITRLPAAGQTITVETWPMPTTRVAYPRSTVGYDEQGNVLFRVISLWVLMDTQSRAMLLPGKSGVQVSGSVRGGELAVPGSIAPKPLKNTRTRVVEYTELDRNLHMNNTRYLDWIDALLPSIFHKENPVRAFTICYLSEAREGQQIRLSWEPLEAGLIQVEGLFETEHMDDAHHRVFSAVVQF